MKFIATTGPIGHGKSTFADNVQHLEPTAVHFESGELISEVANEFQAEIEQPLTTDNIQSINNWVQKLPAILEKTLHIQTDADSLAFTQQEVLDNPLQYAKLFEHVALFEQDTSIANITITPENKTVFRPILQWLGGYLVQKVGPGIWFDELVRRGEAAGKQGAEVCVVGALRFPSDESIMRRAGAHIVKVYRPDHEEADMSDPTESSRDIITPDTTIINNGSLADFTHTTELFLIDLKQGQTKPRYITTSS